MEAVDSSKLSLISLSSKSSRRYTGFLSSSMGEDVDIVTYLLKLLISDSASMSLMEKGD